MARKQLQELRTTLSLDNDQFNRSAKETKSDLNALRSEMKFVKSSGDDYANSMEGLKKQSDILNRTLKVQTSQMDSVKKKYDEAVKASGENSTEARRLQSQYNNLASQINKTESQLDSINSKIDNQSNKWKQLSRRANEVGDSFQDAGDKMSSFGQTMSASVTAPIVGFGALAVESTREFREDLAKLEINAKMAGTGIDVMHNAMRDLNAITGETDSNVEALSNLMATGMDDNQLMQAVDDLSGAVIRFPDTLKIEGLADGLQETLATGKSVGTFAELLERMGVNLEDFDEGLGKAKKSGNELEYALDQLNKLDLSNVNSEFRETNKELVEAREAQYDFQTSFAELGRKLEPIATRITEGLTDIIDAFNQLEPETQDNIIKFAGLAAAIGPVSMGLGGLTSGIGGLVKIGGSLSGLLGKAGGKALLGRIAGLGVSGPVGLAIGGVTAMGLATQYLVEDTKNLYDASFDKVRQMDEEIRATDELIASFEELSHKNQLSSSEMLEYMDILDDLSSTSSPEKIAELRDRQAELLEKSGFTNDEMQEFLDLNDKIIEKSPATVTAISEEGNAYADNLQALKDLNTEKREQMMMEAEQQLMEGLRDERDLLAEQLRLQKEKNDAFNDHQSKHDKYMDSLTTVNELAGRRSDLEADMQELLDQNYSIESDKVQAIVEQIGLLDDKQLLAEDELDTAKENLDTAQKTLDTKDEELGKVNEELQRLDDLKYEYEALWLAHLGINAEKGQGLKAIDEELGKLDEKQNDLDELHAKGVLVTDDYNDQKEAIENQRDRLKEAKDELEQINKLASETPYEKEVNITTHPDLETIERELTSPLRRQLYMDIHGLNAIRLPSYAEGTDYHSGGAALVGEEGFELAKMGSQWSMLGFGVTDLPRGTQVFTNDESKRIIQALNNMPSYASGISPSGEASRVVDSLNGKSQGEVVIYTTVINEMNGREISREIYRDVTEFQNRDQRVRESFA